MKTAKNGRVLGRARPLRPGIQLDDALKHSGARQEGNEAKSEDRMLDRALMHVRAAIALRDCAASAPSDVERRLLMKVAAIHEARARKVLHTKQSQVRRR